MQQQRGLTTISPAARQPSSRHGTAARSRAALRGMLLTVATAAAIWAALAGLTWAFRGLELILQAIP